jgi:hypothetical protein
MAAGSRHSMLVTAKEGASRRNCKAVTAGSFMQVASGCRFVGVIMVFVVPVFKKDSGH